MKKLTALFLLAFFFCKLFAQSNIPSYVPTNSMLAWNTINENADESGNEIGNNVRSYDAPLVNDRFFNSSPTFSQNWTTINVSGNINKIDFNQQIGIAVGDNGIILKTIDGGQSFSNINSNITDNLVDVKFIGNNTFIACGWKWGNHGIVLKSTDNGNNWSTIISLNGQFNELFGIYCKSFDTIFVSGTNQIIRTFNCFSTSYTTYFPNGYQYRAAYLGNNLISMAHAGTIIFRKSNDNGDTYNATTQQPNTNMLRDLI